MRTDVRRYCLGSVGSWREIRFLWMSGSEEIGCYVGLVKV
jgi:hypothetical protein